MATTQPGIFALGTPEHCYLELDLEPGAWVRVAGGDRTAVFGNARTVLAELAGVARVGAEVTGWLYRHDRDLTGFVDGTENPSLLTAAEVAAVPRRGTGCGLEHRAVPGLAARHRDLGVAGGARPGNVAYGGVTDHGTAFVGFARDQWRLAEMLRRMAGATGGIRDGPTGFLTPLTGAYYTCPPVDALARFAPPRVD